MIFEITVKRAVNDEVWLVRAKSIEEAITKAASRLRRRPRMYEGWSIVSADRVRGFLIN